MVGAFFDLPVADTQTGCKVFRRDVLAAVVPLLHEQGFAIDLELFVAAHAFGLDDFVGGRCPSASGSRAPPSAAPPCATLREALTVLARLRLGHAYGPARSSRWPSG